MMADGQLELDFDHLDAIFSRLPSWLTAADVSVASGTCRLVVKAFWKKCTLYQMPSFVKHIWNERFPEEAVDCSSGGLGHIPPRHREEMPSLVHAQCVRCLHLDNFKAERSERRHVWFLMSFLLQGVSELHLRGWSVNPDFLRAFVIPHSSDGKLQNMRIQNLEIDNDCETGPVNMSMKNLSFFPALQHLELSWVTLVPDGQSDQCEDLPELELELLVKFQHRQWPWDCHDYDSIFDSEYFCEKLPKVSVPKPPNTIIRLHFPLLRILELSYATWWPAADSLLPSLTVLSLTRCTVSVEQLEALLSSCKASIRLIHLEELPRAGTPSLSIANLPALISIYWVPYCRIRANLHLSRCPSLRIVAASRCHLEVGQTLQALEVFAVDECTLEDDAHTKQAIRERGQADASSRTMSVVRLDKSPIDRSLDDAELHRWRGRIRSHRCSLLADHKLKSGVQSLMRAHGPRHGEDGACDLFVDRLAGMRSFFLEPDVALRRWAQCPENRRMVSILLWLQARQKGHSTKLSFLKERDAAHLVFTYLSEGPVCVKRNYAAVSHAFLQRARLLWRSACISRLDQIPVTLHTRDSGHGGQHEFAEGVCPIKCLTLRNYTLPSRQRFGDFKPLRTYCPQALRVEGPLLRPAEHSGLEVLLLPDGYERLVRAASKWLKIQQVELINDTLWQQTVDLSSSGLQFQCESGYEPLIKRLKLLNIVPCARDPARVYNGDLEELLIHDDVLGQCLPQWSNVLEVLCDMPKLKVLKFGNGMWFPSARSSMPRLTMLVVSQRSMPLSVVSSMLTLCSKSLRVVHLLHLPCIAAGLEIVGMTRLRLFSWRGYSKQHQLDLTVRNCPQLRVLVADHAQVHVDFLSCPDLNIVGLAHASLHQVGESPAATSNKPTCIALGMNVTVRASSCRLDRQARCSEKLDALLDARPFVFEASMWDSQQDGHYRWDWLNWPGVSNLLLVKTSPGKQRAQQKNHPAADGMDDRPSASDIGCDQVVGSTALPASHDIDGCLADGDLSVERAHPACSAASAEVSTIKNIEQHGSDFHPAEVSCRGTACKSRRFSFEQPRVVGLCSNQCRFAWHDSCFSQLRRSFRGNSQRHCVDSSCSGVFVSLQKVDGDRQVVKVYHRSCQPTKRSVSRSRDGTRRERGARRSQTHVVEPSNVEGKPECGDRIAEKLEVQQRKARGSRSDRRKQRSASYKEGQEAMFRAKEEEQRRLVERSLIEKHLSALEQGAGPNVGLVLPGNISEEDEEDFHLPRRGRSPRQRLKRVGEWQAQDYRANLTTPATLQSSSLVANCTRVAARCGVDFAPAAAEQLAAIDRERTRFLKQISEAWRFYVMPAEIQFLPNHALCGRVFRIRGIKASVDPELMLQIFNVDGVVVERILVAPDTIEFPCLGQDEPAFVFAAILVVERERAVVDIELLATRSGDVLICMGADFMVEVGHLVSLHPSQSLASAELIRNDHNDSSGDLFGQIMLSMASRDVYAQELPNETSRSLTYVAVSTVKFTRPQVKGLLSDGRALYELVNELCLLGDDEISQKKRPLRCVQNVSVGLRTLSNRLLWCYKVCAGICGKDINVPVVLLTHEQANSEVTVGEDLLSDCVVADVTTSGAREQQSMLAPIDAPYSLRFNGPTMPVECLWFTQDTIRPCFRDGRSLYTLVNDLCRCAVNPVTILQPLRVVRYRGALRSLDNRRLWCLKACYGLRDLACVNVCVREEELLHVDQEFYEKNSTRNDGCAVQVSEKARRRARI